MQCPSTRPHPPRCWKDYGVRMGVSLVLRGREELDKQRPPGHWRKVKCNIKNPSVAGGLLHIFFKNIYNKHIQGL